MNARRMLRIAGAAAALVATAIEARRGLPDWEHRIYHFVNDMPDVPAPAVWIPMQAGSLAAPFVLAGWTFRRTRTLDPAAMYAAAGFATWLTAKGVKRVVGRGRPHDHDPTTNLRLATQIDGSLGFVSGHAAVASALAAVMAKDQSLVKRTAVQAFALGVGATRIYAGAHLPLDVVGGAALGILIGETADSIRTRSTVKRSAPETRVSHSNLRNISRSLRLVRVRCRSTLRTDRP